MPAKRPRRRNPAKEKLWRGTILRHQENGLSVRAFCQREELKYADLLRWRRELDRRDREKTPEHPRSANKGPIEPGVSPIFLPVKVVDVDRLPSLPTPPIEIVLDGGTTVRVPAGFDPFAYLNDILRRLPSHPAGQFDDLLPDVWFSSHPSARRKAVA